MRTITFEWKAKCQYNFFLPFWHFWFGLEIIIRPQWHTCWNSLWFSFTLCFGIQIIWNKRAWARSCLCACLFMAKYYRSMNICGRIFPRNVKAAHNHRLHLSKTNEWLIISLSSPFTWQQCEMLLRQSAVWLCVGLTTVFYFILFLFMACISGVYVRIRVLYYIWCLYRYLYVKLYGCECSSDVARKSEINTYFRPIREL